VQVITLVVCCVFAAQNGKSQLKAKVSKAFVNIERISESLPKQKMAKSAIYNFEFCYRCSVRKLVMISLRRGKPGGDKITHEIYAWLAQ
jgi:hypothetical protein